MRYLETETVDEAIGLLAEHGDAAKVLAGGQSLLILMRERLVDVDALIGLEGIPALREIEGNGGARGGAVGTAPGGGRRARVGSPRAGRCCRRPRGRSRRCRCATGGRCAAPSPTRSRRRTRRRPS